MSIKEVNAEDLASLMFHYQAALAPDFDCVSPKPQDWQEMPRNERQRMIAAARLTLLDLANSKNSKTTTNIPDIDSDPFRSEAGRECGC